MEQKHLVQTFTFASIGNFSIALSSFFIYQGSSSPNYSLETISIYGLGVVTSALAINSTTKRGLKHFYTVIPILLFFLFFYHMNGHFFKASFAFILSGFGFLMAFQSYNFCSKLIHRSQKNC